MMTELTESEENKINQDRKNHQLKLIRDIQNKAQKKYDELEANYNDTGSSSTYRTMHYYDDLITVCRLAVEAVNRSCSHCDQHERTAKSLIKKYQDAKATNMADILTFDNVIADLIHCRFY